MHGSGREISIGRFQQVFSGLDIKRGDIVGDIDNTRTGVEVCDYPLDDSGVVIVQAEIGGQRDNRTIGIYSCQKLNPISGSLFRFSFSLKVFI